MNTENEIKKIIDAASNIDLDIINKCKGRYTSGKAMTFGSKIIYAFLLDNVISVNSSADDIASMPYKLITLHPSEIGHIYEVSHVHGTVDGSVGLYITKLSQSQKMKYTNSLVMHRYRMTQFHGNIDKLPVINLIYDLLREIPIEVIIDKMEISVKQIDPANIDINTLPYEERAQVLELYQQNLIRYESELII